jgi:hypothetical protein
MAWGFVPQIVFLIYKLSDKSSKNLREKPNLAPYITPEKKTPIDKVHILLRPPGINDNPKRYKTVLDYLIFGQVEDFL